MSSRGKHLGELEALILLTVLRLKEDAYGAKIRDELRQRAKRTVSISTIYVTLMRLEEKGLVRSWLADPTAKRGGRAKRHFELKPAGVQELRDGRAVLEAMWDGLPELEQV